MFFVEIGIVVTDSIPLQSYLMKDSSNILFMYELGGEDLIWQVVKRFGSEWLCKTLVGGKKARFRIETIRFGQLRLQSVQCEASSV